MTVQIEISEIRNEPWFVKATFPFERKLVEQIKQIPGTKWVPQGKYWKIPVEVLELLDDVEVKDGRPQVTQFSICDANDVGSLYDYQRVGVDRAVAAGRWLFVFETGLGKSATAITAAKLSGHEKGILVVTPSQVKRTWLRELGKWWPEHPEVGVVDYGRGRTSLSRKEKARTEAAYAAPIQIVSYSLLSEVDTTGWAAIIFDEAHYLKSPSSSWSKRALEIVKANPKAKVFGLSATLAPDKPIDVFGPINVVWPGRFGKLTKSGKYSFEFNQRYSVGTQGMYGWKFKGLNGAHEEELVRRLNGLMTRATKKQYAHLLPAFNVSSIYIQPDSPRDYEGIMDAYQTGRSHEELVESILLRAGDEKIPHAIEWGILAKARASHVCILTHQKKSARAIAEALDTTAVTGEMPAKQRDAHLEKLKAAPQGILVATMHSIGIGIDLTSFTEVLFAELYWRPATVIQALGRFSRLSSKLPATCYFMVMESTMDEQMALRLEEKIADINKAIESGMSEEKLEGAFAVDEEEFMASLAAKYGDDDE